MINLRVVKRKWSAAKRTTLAAKKRPHYVVLQWNPVKKEPRLVAKIKYAVKMKKTAARKKEINAARQNMGKRKKQKTNAVNNGYIKAVEICCL